ncbi:MAG: lysine--tRNA ligase, partial [Dermatophilaceae bacterium]
MSRSADRTSEPTDWVTRAADRAIEHARLAAGAGTEVPSEIRVTCASGISPSGPIHLGNLREFLTVHFVAEEIRRRGIAVRHLQSWDDYDRFRRVPHGVDESWTEHVGRPLSAVPDPWRCHPNWAEHFKAPLRAALTEMGCEMVEIDQTGMYTSGAYRDQILEVVRRRAEIDAVLGRYRTKAPVPASEQEAAALRESILGDSVLADAAGADDPTGGTESEEFRRFPFKPYCRQCGRDTVAITAYDEDTTDLSYVCEKCGFEGV